MRIVLRRCSVGGQARLEAKVPIVFQGWQVQRVLGVHPVQARPSRYNVRDLVHKGVVG